MTPQIAQQLLPDGPRIPIPTLFRLGELLNPFNFARATARELVQLGDLLNESINRDLIQAQQSAAGGALKSPQGSSMAEQEMRDQAESGVDED